MDNIYINKSIQPSTPNTPLDARTVVDTEIDIRSIKLPYVGMLVYVISSGKTYQIKSLMPGVVGNKDFTVPDMVVGEYEEFSGGASGNPSTDVEYTAFMVSAKDDTMTHLMTICTHTLTYTNSDVVVDWGDGSRSTISAGDFEHGAEWSDVDFNIAKGEYNYTVKHTYKEVGVYTIKISGKGYYRVKGFATTISTDGTPYNVHSNLICKLFSDDLPLSEHITNVSGLCYMAGNLEAINAYYLTGRRISDASYMCYGCYNLVKAEGFIDTFTTADCSHMFDGCSSLEFSDAKLPLNAVTKNSCAYMYSGCSSLNVKINTLLPSTTGAGTYIMDAVFYGCSSIPASGVPADRLWLCDGATEFITNATEFIGCSDELRAIVPESWGGLSSDPAVYLVQVDWAQTDDKAIDYIKNKPRLQDMPGYDDLVAAIKADILKDLGIVSSYGYVTDDMQYQPVTTDEYGNVVTDGGPQVLDNLYVYDSGKPDPEY